MVERVNEYHPDEVSPPGETLLEMLDERSMTQADLAARMGRPRKTVNEIVKGKAAITPETALQLEKVVGAPASFWLDRERYYQEYLARRREADRLAEGVSWLQELPLREMIRCGWIRRLTEPAQQVWECLTYFGVASPEQWRSVYANVQVEFRKSARLKASPGAISAWLRKGEIEAAGIDCASFDERRFRDVLSEARSLTTASPEAFVPKLQELCGAAGVAVAFVPELKGCRCWGATRWLSPTKALIQLSLRYRTDDHLWFTFFHEAAHILLHGKKEVFLESEGDGEGAEREANQFAADMLIPPAAYRRLLLDGPRFSQVAVKAFARGIGISPGIVVGRLQHDGHLPPSHLNGLKIRFEWRPVVADARG